MWGGPKTAPCLSRNQVRPMPAFRSTMMFAWLMALVSGCQPSAPSLKSSMKSGGEAGPASVEHAAGREVIIFAAASTQEPIETLVDRFQGQHPGVEVRASFAASSILAEQIAAGASADLFLSASRQWIDFLHEKNLVGEQHDLLGNQLVTVVAVDATLPIAMPDDLANDEVEHIAMGEPDSVPAGIYAKQALAKLGLWDTLKEKMVATNDVRHALALVETGAAEVAIVYATDAAVSKKVKVALAFNPELTGPIIYPLALLNQGVESSAARELYQFLQSPAADAVFRQAGFRVQPAAGAH